MGNDGFSILDDIDEHSLKELDRRLLIADVRPNKHQDQRRQFVEHAAPFVEPSKPTQPTAPINASVQNPVAADFKQPDLEEEARLDFIAELEREVASLNQGKVNPQDHLHKAQQLHEALSRIFSFLHQLSHHANQLQPEICRIYRLDPQSAYSDLRWHGAFADCRKKDLSEKAHLSHVSFRVRLVAPQPIILSRRWDQLEILKRDLHILNLRTVDESFIDVKTEQEFIELKLAPDFPVQINFRGDYDARRIDVLSRNLEGFCISAFVLDIDQVNQSMLDGLGRFLLSRSNALPEAFRRINYVPPKVDP